MKKGLLFLFFGVLMSTAGYSQNCFLRLHNAFDERGANAVADDMHRHVYVSFFEDGTARCVLGKTRNKTRQNVSKSGRLL